VAPEDAARVGGVVLGESRRLERLVADLLDLARLRADSPSIHPQPTDLVVLGREVEAVWSARCAAVGIPFTYVPAAASAPTVTDPVRLRQLVDGLLENALRVTPSGRPVVVEVRTEAAPDRPPVHVVEVRDGGPGLTDDDLAVAFEPSVLHERYRGLRPVGTGLGLAIVGRLAELLGGRVEAGHAAEGGARFTLRLPTAPASVMRPNPTFGTGSDVTYP
jgi:two-component system sensor histidine kinase BaeS